MSNLFRFGQFELDPARRTLCCANSPVSLTPRAFDVLLFLLQNPNRLVTKEELLQAVWGDSFVEEGNLTQYISHVRKALGENSDDARLIVTIARKGYQFTARVTTVAAAAARANYAALQPAATQSSKTDALPVGFPSSAPVGKSPPPRLRLGKWFATVAVLTVIAISFWLYLSYRHRLLLSTTDTIVLADVKNETGDPVFDDALDTALRYEMEQTPYLNILGADKVSGTLAQLNLPPTTKLTPEVARQICGKTNSKLVISQSIGDAGNGYYCSCGRSTAGRERPWPKSRRRLLSGMRSSAIWESQPHGFARSWESPKIRWRTSISLWKRCSALRLRLYRPSVREANFT